MAAAPAQGAVELAHPIATIASFAPIAAGLISWLAPGADPRHLFSAGTRQRAHVLQLAQAGEHTIAELFSVSSTSISRSTGA